jgi:hypothetical protein
MAFFGCKQHLLTHVAFAYISALYLNEKKSIFLCDVILKIMIIMATWAK